LGGNSSTLCTLRPLWPIGYAAASGSAAGAGTAASSGASGVVAAAGGGASACRLRKYAEQIRVWLSQLTIRAGRWNGVTSRLVSRILQVVSDKLLLLLVLRKATLHKTSYRTSLGKVTVLATPTAAPSVILCGGMS
jgi:hypothetical protein